jgi:fumarylacetoacetase
MHLPVQCGDYTDFYSSRQHAFNVGSMFRGPENALMPNWLHLPVGYHGRSSSLVPSGTPLHRPWGQVKPADQEVSSFSKSKQLDFELEMAYVIGHGNTLGQPIPIAEAESHVWGYCLFNDWSARDIQSWEYVPLGPFLGKNFGSSLSPWVVTPEALTHCRISGTEQSPPVLPYLQSNGNDHFDIQLEVILRTEAGEEMTICRSNTENLYWSVAQQIAHHTVNGCNLNTGDICASGTISGPNPENFGSMLELTWRGTKPLVFPSGAERKFIEDGDTLIMRAFAQGEHDVISFGEVKTTILPAIDYPLSEG